MRAPLCFSEARTRKASWDCLMVPRGSVTWSTLYVPMNVRINRLYIEFWGLRRVYICYHDCTWFHMVVYVCT